jgi:hypothetical protein
MYDWNKCDHILKSIKSFNWKCNSQEKKWAKKAIKNNRWFYFKIKNMTNINILNEIKSKNCKNDKKKRNDKNQTMKRKQQKMIFRILNLQIWQIWDHLNMQVCLLTKRLTILFKETLFTILIVMIHLFMIWIDS